MKWFILLWLGLSGNYAIANSYEGLFGIAEYNYHFATDEQVIFLEPPPLKAYYGYGIGYKLDNKSLSVTYKAIPKLIRKYKLDSTTVWNEEFNITQLEFSIEHNEPASFVKLDSLAIVLGLMVNAYYYDNKAKLSTKIIEKTVKTLLKRNYSVEVGLELGASYALFGNLNAEFKVQVHSGTVFSKEIYYKGVLGVKYFF